MFNEKVSILVSAALLAVLFSYSQLSGFPKYFGIFSLIILANLLVKKVSAYYLEVRTKMSVWDWQQYWFAERHKFPRPIPIGIVLPIIISLYSYGLVRWLGVLETNFEAKITKAARKRKAWSYPGLRELDVALICFAGFVINIILAFIFIGFSPEVSKLALAYTLFNLIPLGKLDGMRLAMSNRALYLITILVFAASTIVLSLFLI